MRLVSCFTLLVFFAAFQTALRTASPRDVFCFDGMIALIVYMILMRSRLETWFTAIVAGIGVNMLSGAPMGVYLISYIWMIVLFRNIKSYFHTSVFWLFVALVVIGIVIEQVIFGAFFVFYSGIFRMSWNAVYLTWMQIFWAAVLSPVIFLMIRKVFEATDQLRFRTD